MKRAKVLLSITAVCLFDVFSPAAVFCQVSGMAFSSSSGTYTAITGGTVHSTSNTWDDSPNFTAVPIGFTFNFNGVDYTTLSISMNGFISFGATAPGTTNYTPISSVTAYAGAVSGFGRDLQGVVGLGEIRSETSGGVFTVQWAHARRYNGGTANAEDFEFQIKLYETSNKIEVVYGAFSDAISASNTNVPQVGLRGATNADFNNREVLSSGDWGSSTAGAANTATCYYNQATPAVKPASGLTYTWELLTQTYVSSTTTQNTNAVLQGALNAQIVGVEVVMSGSLSPLDLTSVSMNTNGTTTPANILNARLFYTGTSPVFSTATQYGLTVATPSGSFGFTGTQSLVNGTNYFWLAYDVSGGATVGNQLDAECTSITVGSPQTPSVTAPAGSRAVAAPLSGTKTVGSGGDYASLTAALSDVTNIGLGGSLNLDIISDLSLAMVPDTAVVINPWPESGIGGYTLTIRPSGGPRTIAGNSATAVIKINGADRVVIDGRIAGSGRNLTITNASASTASGVIWVSNPSAADSANNITIRNCNILGSAAGAQIVALAVSGATVGSVPLSAPTNITIRDNYISKSQNLIYFSGVSTTRFSTGNQVLDNLLGSSTVGDGFLVRGMHLNYHDGIVVSGNDIQNNAGSSGTMDGMLLLESKNSTVSGNKVHMMQYTGSSTTKVYGINQSATTNATPAAPSLNSYINNAVYDLSSSATSASWNTSGINNNGGYGDKYYFNSVYLSGQMSASGTGGSAAFSNGNGITSANADSIDVRNNIFYMNGSSLAAAKLYAHYTTNTTYPGSTLNHNDLLSAASGSATAFTGRFNAVDYASLALWQGATGEGVNSIESDPMFNSATNLAPLPGSPILAAGQTIAGITTDILGTTRGTPPSMGAYETAGDVAGPAYIYTPLTNTGSVANRTITVNITDVGGVAAGGNAPRIYFRKGIAGAYTNANATSVLGDDYTFTIDNSLIGGVTGGDVVQYYFASQDVAGPNGSTSPAGGSGINPPGTTPPAGPNSYLVLVTVSSFPYTEDFEGPQPDIFLPVPPVAKPAFSETGGEKIAFAAPPELTSEQSNVDLSVPGSVGTEMPQFAGTGPVCQGAQMSMMTGGLGWSTGIVAGALNDWIRGTPAKTQLSGAHSGTKAYVTLETGTYNNSHDAALYSPVLDFSSLGSDPTLSFWHNFQSETGFTGYDAAVVEYSIDGGTTWLRVDSTLGSVATPDSNWTTLNSDNWYNVTSPNGPIDGHKYSSISGASTGSINYTGNVGGWINTTSVLAGTAGLADVRLRFRWGTDGSIVAEGWAIDDVSIFEGSGVVNVNVTIATGWNMISNPVTAANDSVKVLYPNSLFNYAFSFGASGYVQDYTMENGPGFWGKFPGAEVNGIAGVAILADTIGVNTGWNMVGSLSSDIDTSFVDDPGGIRLSDWFGYSAGYFTATEIVAGQAYWVKASAAGNFIFSTTLSKPAVTTPNVLEGLNSMTIKDSRGGSQTLYFGPDNGRVQAARFAMPPLPPTGAFDARFENASGGAMVQTHEAGAIVNMPVNLQTEAYPITISWNIANAGTYELADANGGNVRTMQGQGNTTIGGAFAVRSTGLDGLPKEYALYQNYPNPFNPSTNIRFALPVQSRVTAEIYNTLGQRVKVLVNEGMTAGYHIVEWNGTGNSGLTLGSGAYFIRLSASSDDGKSFSDVRKLMLMK